MEADLPNNGNALASLDPLVLGKIIAKSSWQTRLQLERTCRQICTVARQTHPLSMQLRGEEGTLFCKVPPQRAFKGCTYLSYVMTSTGSSLLAMTAALGYAAMYCPHLSHVKLQFEVPASARAAAAQHGWTVDMRLALEETCLVGALTALQLMPALRKLELFPLWFSRVTCQSLAALTGLTSLRLGVPLYVADSHMYGDLSALSGLTGLTELVLDDLRMLPMPPSPATVASAGSSRRSSSLETPCSSSSDTPQTAAAAAAVAATGSWLPASLHELQLAARKGTHMWLPHVVTCSSLRKLVVRYPASRYSWQAHPTVVIQTIASSLQQLRHLEFQGGDDGVSWELDNAPAEVREQIAGPGISSELVVPVAELAQLQQLEQLITQGSLRLAVTSEAHWCHLAACPALLALEQLQAFCTPPEALVLSGVTRVCVRVNGPVTPVYELLSRCPVLQSFELDYDISPIFEGWVNERCASQPQLAARLRFRAFNTYIFAALMHQLCNCLSLDLLWAFGDRLPDLGELPHLQKLVLRWQPGAHNAPAKQVYPEDLLHMLQGCKQLQVLEVHRVQFVTARYALMLQYQHPQLQLLKLVGCGDLEGAGDGPSDPDRLRLVQQLLRPGLQVVEEPAAPRLSLTG